MNEVDNDFNIIEMNTCGLGKKHLVTVSCIYLKFPVFHNLDGSKIDSLMKIVRWFKNWF